MRALVVHILKYFIVPRIVAHPLDLVRLLQVLHPVRAQVLHHRQVVKVESHRIVIAVVRICKKKKHKYYRVFFKIKFSS